MAVASKAVKQEPVGWKCPQCGRSVRPDLETCPCGDRYFLTEKAAPYEVAPIGAGKKANGEPDTKTNHKAK